MALFRFVGDSIRSMFRGGPLYWAWIGFLLVLAAIGMWAYSHQLHNGLIVTGMSDQVSWGVYIANFTFLVGLAAAAVLLVIPSYVFHRQDTRAVVLLGEGVAVAACTMCMLFVVVDLGRPDRMWHLIPGIGRFHWPESMLAWDVIVLSGYLFLNFSIPFYILYKHYRGEKANPRVYWPGVLISMFWAISIHTVTAFLFASNPGRPFWHTALLAPRFIASAFASGPAFMVLAFAIIDRQTRFEVPPSVYNMLALFAAVALQINLFMVGTELFTEFYSPTEHSASARFLFTGLYGYDFLVPWVLTALFMEVVAVVILMVHRLRNNRFLLGVACVLIVLGIWIEKGMGLIVPGFLPTTLGEMFEYHPTTIETLVSVGVWAIGFLVFTLLARASIAIDTGEVRYWFSGNATV